MAIDELLRLHAWATVVVQARVAEAAPADLDRPTPCAGWNLDGLLAHMVGQDHGFAAATQADLPASAFAPRPLASSPAAEHAAAGAAVVTAFAVADPAREVLLSDLGLRVPLATSVGMHLLDTLVHGWDVAASLGRPVRYPGPLVAVALRAAERVPRDPAREQQGAAFAPALPDGDSAGDPWHRVLLLLGRDPGWDSAGSAGR